MSSETHVAVSVVMGFTFGYGMAQPYKEFRKKTKQGQTVVRRQLMWGQLYCHFLKIWLARNHFPAEDNSKARASPIKWER